MVLRFDSGENLRAIEAQKVWVKFRIMFKAATDFVLNGMVYFKWAPEWAPHSKFENDKGLS